MLMVMEKRKKSERRGVGKADVRGEYWVVIFKKVVFR